jgi:hypothetical protein
LYLKHSYNLSDEATCERSLENCYWQHFTGEVYFHARLSCEPSSFTRWRQRLGEAGMEELLAQTIEAAKAMRAVTIKDLGRVIIVSTAKRGLIVGARSFLSNPYDGDTLAEQLEQTEILTGHKPRTAIVDLGYRGRTLDGVEILHCGKPTRLTRRQWSWVKRRQAIEPVMGHSNEDCRLRRNRLEGALGDALHVLACAARKNLRWLLRWIALLCRSINRLITALVASLNPEIRMQPA